MTLLLRGMLLMIIVFTIPVESAIRRYNFNIVMKNTTKLCTSKSIVTVNGKFPGPTLYAREDDNVIVKVKNNVQYNVTIHWHGVKQFRTGWSDGPAYITQCPIRPGQEYLYNFTLTGQRGTLLWHAHITWLRATVHGAIVIWPKMGVEYPFVKPYKEKIIVLGEWWKGDVEAMIDQAMQSGLPPNLSDAHTINGYTGPVANCSSEAFTLHVQSNKTYLLRIINAAVNDELFFKIANHNLTIVEVDACYTKPFETDTIFAGPGQTTTALLTTNTQIGKYLIAISPFMDTIVPVDNITTYGFLQYQTTKTSTPTTLTTIPPINSTTTTNTFLDQLYSLNSNKYPTKVPLKIDHSLLFTIGVGINPCTTCINGTRPVANINNITFDMPKIPLLQAHYYNISGVYSDDFPSRPETVYNYTGGKLGTLETKNGTKVYRLGFNETVEVVLQGTSVIAPKSHPTHLHGFNFYGVGKGVGNFDPVEDPKKFNLVDPVERNTINVPTAGWTAIRFRADNPGVWLLHCHLEVHTTWGLKMAFVVENGDGPNESLLPPPTDLPHC